MLVFFYFFFYAPFPKQGPAHIVSHARRVLNLVIIWILGYFWDAHMQLGSIPTSCHPKPQLSTMFGLCSDKKKLDFNNDGFARKESIKPASVTDLWFTTLKIQKRILSQNWTQTISSLLYVFIFTISKD